MKKFNFFRFCMMMAVALFAGATMVACGDDEEPTPGPGPGPEPTPEVKAPTVTVTAGEATENTLSFTVATTDAEELAYVYGNGTIDNTAEGILANGTKLEAKASQVVTIENLEPETTYYIFAAVANKEGKAVSQTLEMTTTESTAPKEVKLWLSENTLESTADGTTKGFQVYVENSDAVPAVTSDNPTMFIPTLYSDSPATDENYPDAIVYTLHVDVMPNRVEEEQTATITVTLGELSETIACRQDAYEAPLQKEGAVTIVFSTKFPSSKVEFDAAGTEYEWDGFKLTFYNNSGDFSWMYGLSGFLNMENGDAVKIDGMGKTMNKVEWMATDYNFLDCGMKTGDVTLTPSEYLENGILYYMLTWEGDAVESIEFVTAFNENLNADTLVAPGIIRITYLEAAEE